MQNFTDEFMKYSATFTVIFIYLIVMSFMLKYLFYSPSKPKIENKPDEYQRVHVKHFSGYKGEIFDKYYEWCNYNEVDILNTHFIYDGMPAIPGQQSFIYIIEYTRRPKPFPVKLEDHNPPYNN